MPHFLRATVLLAGVFACLTLLPEATRRVEGAPQDRVRVFLTLSGKAGPAEAAAVNAAGGKVRHAFATSNVISVEVPVSAVDGLKHNPRFLDVRPVPEVTTSEDQLIWGVDRVEADRVWGDAQGAVNVAAGANGGAGIRVAVIDTGIDATHPGLLANLKGGTNFVGTGCVAFSFTNTCTQTVALGPNDWDDDNGHGSHVAGIVGALDNGSGVIGVAPKVDLYAVKALDYAGSGSLDDAIAGIEWATGLNGGVKASIINMSFGCDCDDPALKAAVDAAAAAGVLLVGAAGNTGPGADSVIYPAHYDSVIAVGATCGTIFSLNCSGADQAASFSSTGPALELAAPGDTIKSTWKDGGYSTISGTSMASPHVAGAAALVWAANPGWTAAQVRQRLADTAIDLGAAGRDPVFGYGLINVYAATRPVGQVNHAPVAQDGSVAAREDSNQAITLQASDADGDPLSYVIVSPPAHGTLTGSGANRIYHGASNYSGPDSFQFQAYDGIVNGNVATISITVTAVNDAPRGVNDTAETPQDQPVTISVLANDTDADGDTISLLSAGPTSSKGGSVTANPDGTVTYRPPPGFNGIDTFTYRNTDGHGGTGSATVSVAVGNAPSLHVADIDGSASTLLSMWRGNVTITVHDQNHMPVANVTVTGTFANGLTLTGACKTNSAGTCGFGSNYASSGSSGTFTVTNLALSAYVYLPGRNHDPDGDSNGTTITITR
jgi:subtilisin family serine protease